MYVDDIKMTGKTVNMKPTWKILMKDVDPEEHYFSWSCDMEGHAKKCVERYCELANKTTQQLYKVATPCMDDHQFQDVSVGELSSLLSNCCQMSVSGSYWETWLFMVITQVNTDNIVMWKTQHNNADLEYFQTLILQEIPKT